MPMRLYEDFGGEYFPYLPDENQESIERPDGAVERVFHEEETSSGTVVEGNRGDLTADKRNEQTRTHSSSDYPPID